MLLDRLTRAESDPVHTAAVVKRAAERLLACVSGAPHLAIWLGSARSLLDAHLLCEPHRALAVGILRLL